MRSLLLLLTFVLSACSANLTQDTSVAFEQTGVMVNTDNEWYLEYAESGATLSKILSMTSATHCTVAGAVQPCIDVTPAQGQRVRVEGTMQSRESTVVRAAVVELE